MLKLQTIVDIVEYIEDLAEGGYIPLDFYERTAIIHRETADFLKEMAIKNSEHMLSEEQQGGAKADELEEEDA